MAASRVDGLDRCFHSDAIQLHLLGVGFTVLSYCCTVLCRRYLNDHETGYHGGFEVDDLDQVFTAMQSNYTSWVSGFSAVFVGDADSRGRGARVLPHALPHPPGHRLPHS